MHQIGMWVPRPQKSRRRLDFSMDSVYSLIKKCLFLQWKHIRLTKDIWRRSIHFYSSTSGRDIFKIKPCCFFLTSVQNGKTHHFVNLSKKPANEWRMRRVCTVGSHRSPFNQTEAGPGYRFPAPSTNQHPKVDFVVGESVTRTKEDLFVKKWGKFNRERAGWHKCVVWWCLFENWENEQDLKPQEGVLRFFWWIVPQQKENRFCLIPCS